MSERLAVVEEHDRFLVVREDDPSDWLCAFARDGDFPAERWARNMASTYNERLELSDGARGGEPEGRSRRRRAPAPSGAQSNIQPPSTSSV